MVEVGKRKGEGLGVYLEVAVKSCYSDIRSYDSESHKPDVYEGGQWQCKANYHLIVPQTCPFPAPWCRYFLETDLEPVFQFGD
jgi:hypothetical protein